MLITVVMKVGNITGKVKTVLLRGQVAIDNNECLIEKGYGKFIKRNKVSQII